MNTLVRVVLGVAVAGSLLRGGLAVAAEETEKSLILDEMVVSDTNLDVRLLDTPGTVNIFTAEDIEKGGYVDVADVIKSLPGIMDDTTNPATPKFNFRGTAYAHSRGATVYVDGREVTSGRLGFGDLNFVDLSDVEQIQVIKTPSAEFAEPSRGIIYITTKKGKTSGHEQQVKVNYGSWGLHNENVSASGRQGAFDYRVSANNQGGDGYRYTEDERQGMQFKTGYNLSDTTRIGLGGGYQDQQYYSATSLDRWQWDRDARDNTPPNSQTNPTYDLLPADNDVQIADVYAEFSTDQANWFAKSLISLMDNDTEYLSQTDRNKYKAGKDTSSYLRDANEDRLTLKASGGHKYKGTDIRNTLTVGAEYDGHDYDQIRTYPYLAKIDATRAMYMQQYDLDIGIDRTSVYVSNDLRLWEKLGLQTGLRADHVELSFENAYAGNSDVENTYNEIPWNISPSYSFTGRDNLYFTVSQSYFYPNIDYTRMAAQANDDYPENDPANLKPEDILTYELGYKHQVNRFFNYSVAIFHMTVNDKFIFQYRYDEDEDTWDSLGAVNLGRTVHRGIEVEIDGWLTDWLNYRLNYGYLDAKWKDAEAVYSSFVWADDPADDYKTGMHIDGMTLSRTPKNKVGATLAFFPTDRLTAWLNLTYVDKQYVDYLERVEQPAVTTLDCKLAYEFGKGSLGIVDWEGLTLHGLVKNVTDEDYAYYSNSDGERNADGILATSYYPYSGRYFEIGLSMKF